MGRSPVDRRYRVVVVGVVTAAFLLRVARLGSQELWVDEAFSYFLATMRDWGRYTVIDSTPPLYYLLLRAWCVVAGTSEASLRLLSACFGTAFVGASIWVGRVVCNTRVGVWAGLFAAVAPLPIYYSQEARAYALFVLVLQLMYGFLWRALEENSWKWWAAASASALVALYTHYFTLLALAATCFLPILRRDRGRGLRLTASVLVPVLLFSPWVLVNLRAKAGALTHGSPLAWIGRVWEHTPPILAIPKSLEALGLGPQKGLLPLSLKQLSALEVPPALRVLGLALLLGLGLWAILPWGDRGLAVPRPGVRKACLCLLLFFPLGVLWVVSFWKPLYVAGRFDLVALPAYVLLVGLALGKLQSAAPRGPIVASLVFLVLLVPMGTKLERYYHQAPTNRRRDTAAALESQVLTGDVVVFTGLRGLGTLYYLERLGIRWDGGFCRGAAGKQFACRLFPRDTETTLAASLTGDVPTVETVREDLLSYVAALEPDGGRVWLVLDEPAGADTLLVQELRNLGFEPESAHRALKILKYQRVPRQAGGGLSGDRSFTRLSSQTLAYLRNVWNVETIAATSPGSPSRNPRFKM